MTYGFTAMYQTTQYRLRTAGGSATCDTAYSNIVTITVDSLPDFDWVEDTTICTAVVLDDLISNVSTGSKVYFYEDALGTIVLPSTRVGIVSDTSFYVRAINSTTGCESEVRELHIRMGSYLGSSPTVGPESVCIGDTIELSNMSEGVWSISDPVLGEGELIDPAVHSVKLRGVSEGRVFVTYTVGTAACQTKTTHRVRILPATPPKIIIGVDN
jgi:hypothetical protein